MLWGSMGVDRLEWKHTTGTHTLPLSYPRGAEGETTVSLSWISWGQHRRYERTYTGKRTRRSSTRYTHTVAALISVSHTRL